MSVEELVTGDLLVGAVGRESFQDFLDWDSFHLLKISPTFELECLEIPELHTMNNTLITTGQIFWTQEITSTPFPLIDISEGGGFYFIEHNDPSANETNETVQMIKYSFDGTLAWTLDLPTISRTHPYSGIIKSLDDHVIFMGRDREGATPPNRLLKITETGELVNDALIDNLLVENDTTTAYNDKYISIHPVVEGYIIIGYRDDSFSSEQGIIKKVALNYTTEWETLGEAGDMMRFFDIIETNDNSFATIGVDYGSDSFAPILTSLTIFNQEGDLIMNQTYDVTDSTNPKTLLQTGDGDFVLNDLHLIRVSENGQLEWDKLLSQSANMLKVIEMANGDLTGVGLRNTPIGIDMYIARVDPNGNFA